MCAVNATTATATATASLRRVWAEKIFFIMLHAARVVGPLE